jgi:outer membrane lipopolysaccharide assembly protein LptE/RlpB
MVKHNGHILDEVRGSFISSLVLLLMLLSLSSCGYHLVGSRYLPFDSVTIKPVVNKTFEPLLEERLHRNLSREFILQGIDTLLEGGDMTVEATIMEFELRAIGAVEKRVKEEMIVMKVDMRITESGRVTNFKGMRSPITVTFQSEGSVSEAVARKEKAIEKVCAEIAKEFVSKIAIRYAK